MRSAALAAMLALTGCMQAPEIVARDGRTVVPLSGGITDSMHRAVVHSPAPAMFALPKNGGWINEAEQIARAINMRGDCVQIGADGILQSSGVVIFRMANCRVLTDPDARVFGIHQTGTMPGPLRDDGNRWYFGTGIRAPGCLDWYLRQREAAWNGIAFVSWNMMERNCL